MIVLQSSLHPLLNDYIIKLLKKNKIESVENLVQTEPHKLSKLTNLEFDDVRSLIDDLSANYSVDPVDGLTHHNQWLTRLTHLQTFIAPLDELLGGGLPTGNLIDICGFSAAGKTQLCTTIAVNVASHAESTVLWIDANRDFSARRIYQILRNRKISDVNAFEIMRRIKVEHCTDAYRLVAVIDDIMNKIELYKNVKILIIDSLPTLWFSFHGGKTMEGFRLLGELTNQLRRLAVEYGIVVLAVNIVTRWIPNETNKSANDTILTMMDHSIANKSYNATPALGKFWRSICSMRLLINKLNINNNGQCSQSQDNEKRIERSIRILKCNQLKCGTQCFVKITDSGII